MNRNVQWIPDVLQQGYKLQVSISQGNWIVIESYEMMSNQHEIRLSSDEIEKCVMSWYLMEYFSCGFQWIG